MKTLICNIATKLLNSPVEVQWIIAYVMVHNWFHQFTDQIKWLYQAAILHPGTEKGERWGVQKARTSHLPLRTFQSGLQSFCFLFPRAQCESPAGTQTNTNRLKKKKTHTHQSTLWLQGIIKTTTEIYFPNISLTYAQSTGLKLKWSSSNVNDGRQLRSL